MNQLLLDSDDVDINVDVDDSDDSESTLHSFNLVTTPNDFNAVTLISFMEKGVFKIPSFQRNFVWDIQKSSKLIESLVLGLPIPQIFLYERSRNNFEIIDGQQRLLTLYFFFKGRFPKPATRVKLRDKANSSDTEFFKKSFLEDDEYFSKFSLKLLSKNDSTTSDHPLHNKNYSTLDIQHLTTLQLSTIRNMVVKPANSLDEEHSAMFEIFNRLNSGGMNLNNQEIRMSLYPSEFLDLLIKLNRNPTWRRLISKDALDLRLRDVELILRLFAMLLCGVEEAPRNHLFLQKALYQNSILSFLNKFANQSKNFTSDDLIFFETVWATFMDAIADIDLAYLSNSKEYVESAKVSIPVLEAIFYGLFRDGTELGKVEPIKITNQQLIDLKNKPDFLSACLDKTTSRLNVKARLEESHKFFNVESI